MEKYKMAAMNIAFITLLLTAGLCSGYNDLDDDNANDSIKNRRVEILETFENKDYVSWKNLINKKAEISSIIDENDFNIFIQAREAVRSGKYDQAIALANNFEDSLKGKFKLLGSGENNA